MTTTTLTGQPGWSVHEPQDTCTRSVPSGPATPGDLESPRRSQAGEELNDKLPVQYGSCSPEAPWSASEIWQWSVTAESPSVKRILTYGLPI